MKIFLCWSILLNVWMRSQFIKCILNYHNFDTKLFLKKKSFIDTSIYDSQLPVLYMYVYCLLLLFTVYWNLSTAICMRGSRGGSGWVGSEPPPLENLNLLNIILLVKLPKKIGLGTPPPLTNKITHWTPPGKISESARYWWV